MHRHCLGRFILLVCILAVVGWHTPSAANGGKAKSTILIARLPIGTDTPDRHGRGSCSFTAQVDAALFAATSLQSKYKVLHIRVVNESTTALELSLAKDSVEIDVGGRQIAGVLDLAKKDATLWDSLSPKLRTELAYPARVEPKEEEGIFVFIPDPALDEAPDRIVLKLSSQPTAPIVLEGPQAAC